MKHRPLRITINLPDHAVEFLHRVRAARGCTLSYAAAAVICAAEEMSRGVQPSPPPPPPIGEEVRDMFNELCDYRVPDGTGYVRHNNRSRD